MNVKGTHASSPASLQRLCEDQKEEMNVIVVTEGWRTPQMEDFITLILVFLKG